MIPRTPDRPFSGTQTFFLNATIFVSLLSFLLICIAFLMREQLGVKGCVIVLLSGFCASCATIAINLIVNVLVDIARSMREANDRHD